MDRFGSIEENSISANDVRMWMFGGGILFEDDIDKRWQQQTGEVVREVIFPSRHAAASGKPSLTLHPIGVPHLDQKQCPSLGVSRVLHHRRQHALHHGGKCCRIMLTVQT